MSDATPFELQSLPNHQGVRVLTLEPNQGPMVVLDDLLIRRIQASLAAVPHSATGLILASGSPRVFIAGADLRQIQAMDVPRLDTYLQLGQRTYAMLCSLHCPTVAAINGAALGGGLEIAMHCDGLVAALPAAAADRGPAKPYPIGLPEAGLAICPGWGGTNLLPARMHDAKEAIRMTATGRTITIDTALAAGLLDAMAPTPAALLDTAAAWLGSHRDIVGTRRDGEPSRWIGRAPSRNRVTQALSELRAEFAPGSTTQAASAVLKAVHAGLEEGWQGALRTEREELNRLRHTAEGAAAIKAFFEKTAKK